MAVLVYWGIGESLAECPGTPDVYPNGVIEGCVADHGSAATVAMRADGKFIVGWQIPSYSCFGGRVRTCQDLILQRYEANGMPLGVSRAVTNQVGPYGSKNFDPSLAIGPLGVARVGWIGIMNSSYGQLASTQLWLDLAFDAFDFIPISPGTAGDWDTGVSVGASDVVQATAWADAVAEPPPVGLLLAVGPGDPLEIRNCGDLCMLRRAQYQACLAMRADGKSAMAWADPEDPGDQESPFDVLLQLRNEVGNPVGVEVLVNDPPSETDPSDQTSPAVAFDDLGHIVVAWVGSLLPGCTGSGSHVVYARFFQWSGDPGEPPLAVSDRVIVNSDPEASPLTDLFQSRLAHPSVALYPGDGVENGTAIIVWNAGLSGDQREVHAQYFDTEGVPLGREFRVNQRDGTENSAMLASSGRHTVAMMPDRRAVVAWTEGRTAALQAVYFTLLPTNYGPVAVPDCDPCQQDPGACLPCLLGDVNGDCFVNGLDIQPLVGLLLLADKQCLSFVDLCPADTNHDGIVAMDDLPCFVDLLLGRLCDPGGPPDCNDNGVPDAQDIAHGTSQDCNGNSVPDECDVDPADPDGDGLVSIDCDDNGIPDECDLADCPPWDPSCQDCNSNSVLDACDIAGGTSQDQNANGIPDECEG